MYVMCPVKYLLPTLFRKADSLDFVEVHRDTVSKQAPFFPPSSGFGTHLPTASDTYSITESVLTYRVENGRTYHAYKDGCKPTHALADPL